jgi:hypothetical protein
MKRFLASLAMLALVFGGSAVVAHAQDQTVQQADSQPGVARISLIEGNVSIERADSGEWVAATVNTPLMNGDTISTGPNSRAEVQLDYANVLRLDSSSTAKIANLNRDTIQVQVSQGLANYDVLGQDQAQAEVDTPNVAVHPLANGEYRVEVDSNAQTLVTVRGGQANVSTPQGSTQVESGQLITVEGTNNPQYQISNAAPQDAWDQWNADRDQSIQDAQSWHDTNRYYTGSQSLDGYGRWIYVSGYGNVWQPYQSTDWAPYRDGRWVWEPYYGWTWVSYEPWGWAPYHYGRWFFYDDDWCWWPGPVNYYPAYYPVWAPAYVSFFGFGYAGAGFSFGFGFGNVGWIPCGPADAFLPWYGGGRSFTVINITNINYIQNNYSRYGGFAPLFRGREGYSNYRDVFTNARVRGGASWMSSREFGRAPVPRSQGHIQLADFQRGKMFSGRVPVVPTRGSLQSINRAPNPNTIRRGIGNQRFFTNGHPAPATTSFAEQRAQLESSIRGGQFGGRVGAGRQAFTSGARGKATFSARQPALRNAPASRGFARPAGPAPGANFTQTRNGWHGFGQGNGRATPNGARVNQGRPNTSFGHNIRGNSPAPVQSRGNFHGFAPSPLKSQPAQQRFSPAPTTRPGFRNFSSQPVQPRNFPPARGGVSAPVQRQGGWRTFTPSSQPRPQVGGQRVGSGRQPLNLRQPIVQRRNGGGFQAPRNFNNSAPHNFGGPRSFGGPTNSGGPRNFGGPRNNGGPRSFSGPSYRGPVNRGGGGPSFGAPSPRGSFGGGMNRGGGGFPGGGGAPSYRAPSPRGGFGGGGMNRGGGGFSRGGGGGFSAPRGGGGFSAPRGGGGGFHSAGGHGRGR